MGRPLNKKYFGNRNIGSASTTADNKIGGSRVGSVTVGGVNNSTGYLTGEAVTFSTPDLPGGVTATGTVVATAGAIVSITIVEAGSGYTSVPTATAATGVIGTTTLTAVLQADTGAVGSVTNQENAITVRAFIPAANGGTGTNGGDIIKQVSTTRFKVKTANGTGICKLETANYTLTAGKMTIKATDSQGYNYLVAKITSRKVVLVPNAAGGTIGTQFASGATAKWTFGSAVANTTVTIQNA